jgi:hypothetical protein
MLFLLQLCFKILCREIELTLSQCNCYVPQAGLELGENRTLPISTHIFFIIIDVLIAYHLTEIEARRAAKKYLFYLFNIQESGIRMASLVRHMHGANSHILQPPGVDSTLFTISTRRIEPGTSTSHVDIIDL